MLSDNDFNIPEGNYISGIYNYCDSWCNRCLYTDRCMNYAMREPIEKEAEARLRFEKSMKENTEFWSQINRTMDEAAKLIDEEFPLQRIWQEDPFDMEEEEVEEAMRAFEQINEKAEKDKLLIVAEKYMTEVHDWMKKMEGTLKQEYDDETEVLSCTWEGLNEKALKQLSESCELIRWYEMLISVKVRRALSSQMDEEEHADLLEDFPNDSDGSAMVALKGVNASIGGWTFLHKVILPEKEKIKSFLHNLWFLKTELEKRFPGALTFIWPPEEENETY